MVEEVHAAPNDYNLRSKGPTDSPKGKKNTKNPSTSGKAAKTGKNNTSGKSNSSPTTSSAQSFISLKYDIIEGMKKIKAYLTL